MRSYETTFILAPTLEADGLTGEIDAIKQVITGQGGEVTAEKEWGRRRLAYPLQDHSEGVYHILRFSLENPRGLEELARHFRLNENVLRHLVIRDEGTNLDDVGKVSESEDHHDRDRRFGGRRPYGSRDREPDRHRGPSGPPAPKPAAAPAEAKTPEAPAEAKPEGEAAATEGAPAAAGGEESSG